MEEWKNADPSMTKYLFTPSSLNALVQRPLITHPHSVILWSPLVTLLHIICKKLHVAASAWMYCIATEPLPRVDDASMLHFVRLFVSYAV